MKDRQTRVVFCWHMHQPCYQDQGTRRFLLPWAYLHAIKDYTDMASILQSIPQARAVINFCPLLLEQIDDYDCQVRGFLHDNRPLDDPLLAMLSARVLPLGTDQRREIIHHCLRANEHRLIRPHKPYSVLVELATRVQRDEMPLTYLQDQFFFDLLVWYHLVWLGETVKRSDSRVAALLNKQTEYSYEDRLLLLQIIGELLAAVIPRYRQLAEAGQIELSVTPYSHPMLPLLLDTDCALEALPDAQLPALRYPGGAQRVDWQLQQALKVFEEYFGRRPVGCWPSEGGVSEALLAPLAAAGFQWIASGETVLRNSLAQNKDSQVETLHQIFQFADSSLNFFFRDDKLSDLIGFTYADWHSDDAAANLLEHLEGIHHAGQEIACDSVLPIILDGENCWEHYSHNGYYFLTTLYQSLVSHPNIEMTTFSACLQEEVSRVSLSRLVAGSWVYGNFATWLGSLEKNQAWELLCQAKADVDGVLKAGQVDDKFLARIERQLAICEGSDWFWWFGDYNPGESVIDFDALFRLHLRTLYSLIGIEVPDNLSQVISYGAETAEGDFLVEVGGVMRRSQPP